MKAKDIRLSTLKTYNDCMQAIDDIETDYHNSFGGLKWWCSGNITYLKPAAIKKIKQINARIDRLFISDDEEEGEC